MTRVVIADDHPVFRRGLKALLDGEDGLEVVGDAADGQEAVKVVLDVVPDVVVMDLHMPVLGGVEAAKQIQEALPHVGVLVLTMHEDDELVFAAMKAGARGYLVKTTDDDEIVRAVQAIGAGDAIFSATIAQRMMGYFTAISSSRAVLFPQLTDRERDVLELMASGLDNPSIAHRLTLSGKTVRNRVSAIFTKLQVADRAQAIVRAREAGLGSPSQDGTRVT
ncbi:two component transcriptional regulator, LuxR family [Lentzea albidocapillata subsp. violacea]|uniref:Two component transcriptional regulator, LuxR family n=1 Tax=Lentzea albidocapillata subsp. violacea TaxID=128104 RepID=A0A1G9J3I7_9PSEU|nr:response regulator transcription factor [Lentzea albidocapillata]SDL32060.1 two component transcriptional regulator, LuxR family [Lentzea albidocapillata subsp. violacea]